MGNVSGKNILKLLGFCAVPLEHTAHGRRIGLQKATAKIANQLERMATQVRNLS